MGDVALVAATVLFGAVGIAFRLGYLRKLAWAYVDPSWARSRFYANAMFIMIPAACTLGFAALLTFVDPESTIGMWFGVLSFCSVIWLFVTFIHPPKFLKPQWIREADREFAEDETGWERRTEMLREIGHKSHR